jgi:HD-GYP domain-containing protein (c-di-GMP phosphodiesterase class II)
MSDEKPPLFSESNEARYAESLARVSSTLKRQLSEPTDESLVLVASAHMELKRIPADFVTAGRVECLLDVAQFFNVSGRTILGIEPVSQALQFARQVADPNLLRKALTFSGILLADSGNLPGAIECYAEALEYAIATGWLAAEGSVWNNLGTALLYGAQFAEALQCFERAIELSERAPEIASLRSHALSNIALTCLFVEAYPRGLDAARKSVDESPTPQSASELLGRVNAESTYSRLLLEVDNIEEARRRCQIAKEFAAQSRSQRAELAASIAEGLYEVYSGKVDLGLTRLQNALEQARVMKSPLRDALVALVKAYDMCGKPQLALIHLRELLHHTKKTQQEKALLHHKLHLERIGAEEEDLIQMGAASNSRKLNRDRVRAQLALLHRQAIAAELIEDPSGEHIYRVGRLAGLLAAEDGCDDDTCFLVEMSARLHDIGKLGIPDAILAKRGPINPHEKHLVRTHANIGAEVLGQAGLTQLSMAVDIARHHHEWFDGSGYPDGIAGGAIPRPAQYAALADVYDVLTHKRPYRESMTPLRALLEIKRLRGTKFDPTLADTFIALMERLQQEHSNLDEFLGEEARENTFIKARQKIANVLRMTGGDFTGKPQ